MKLFMMITLAIDGSTRSTGISIFQDNQLIHYQCITAAPSNSLDRIQIMVKAIQDIYNKYKPNHIVMEQVLPQDVKNNQTVFKALIYLQAAVVMMFHKYQKDVKLIVASHWRKVCGIKTGRGIKREDLKKASQNLVKNIYKVNVNDDISDSICLGIAYVKQNRSAF